MRKQEKKVKEINVFRGKSFQFVGAVILFLYPRVNVDTSLDKGPYEAVVKLKEPREKSKRRREEKQNIQREREISKLVQTGRRDVH